MKYSEFKNIIESETVVTETIYNKLVEKSDKKQIDMYFERYINDSQVENNDEKFKRVSYYVEKNSNEEIESKFNLSEYTGESNLDLIQLYLYDIGKKQLITPEEEVKICSNLAIFKKNLDSRGINNESLNIKLKELGYNNISDNTLTGLKNKINYITNKISIEKNNEELNSLLKDIRDFEEYKSLYNEFISCNLRLVISVAKKYVGSGMDFLDLIQEGNLGLDKALERFEVNKGYKFSTYAMWWIRQSITRAIADKSTLIRIPVHQRETIYKLNKAIEKFENIYHRKPNDKELIELIPELSKEKLQTAQIVNNYLIATTSLSTPVGDEEEDELGSFVSDTKNSVEDVAEKNDLKRYLREFLAIIPDKQKLIIILRQGLSINEYLSYEQFKLIFEKNEYYENNEVELKQLYIKLYNSPKIHTLEEVGDIFGITRERVRQIEAKGMYNLRRSCKYRYE